MFKDCEKTPFKAFNQTKPQNLAKHGQKSMIFEFDFKARTWFQKPFKNEALES